MSSGGNYVVPGVPGSGGNIQSINNLIGAITFNSVDGTINVTPTSTTNLSITNPNLVSLNGALGNALLTSTDESVIITNALDSIDLAVKGGNALVLPFSGVTDGTGSYTNDIEPAEG